ncbi:hypothetical protein M6B38_337140 [Iris pallida]|uniref:Uncharacterized protein n=1 Tax=Iris pallida TaxID=29817 RepID=A0AAX6GZ35_IRIPA|nr:hypothetical protein M6B38_337140 [Iris pallida]
MFSLDPASCTRVLSRTIHVLSCAFMCLPLASHILSYISNIVHTFRRYIMYLVPMIPEIPCSFMFLHTIFFYVLYTPCSFMYFIHHVLSCTFYTIFLCTFIS